MQMRKNLPTSTPNGPDQPPAQPDATAGSSAEATAAATNYLRLMQNQQARQTIHSISQLLNTGLSQQTLDICVKLCEAGVHPQSLAEVVRQLRTEHQQNSGGGSGNGGSVA